MLAEEYNIIFMDFTQRQFGAEVTQNISTAESPGR
jgi:hypothetical protein